MARYAIITSSVLRDGHIPAVILERDGTLSAHKNGKKLSGFGGTGTLERALTGMSYHDVEIGEYDDTTKDRIDAIVKTGKLPDHEANAIRTQYADMVSGMHTEEP